MEKIIVDRVAQDLERIEEDLDRRLIERNGYSLIKNGVNEVEIRQADKIKVFIDEAIKYSEAWLGTPYKWGGEAIGEGVDCSGLVRRIMHRCLPDFPGNDMTAQGIMDKLIEMGCDLDQTGRESVRAGHVLFFGKHIHHITHVAFATTPWHMIEAGGGGSRTRTKEDAYAQGAWVRIGLIEKRADLCAHMDPWETL
jgi:cell wall-associated NlpC family hydrolase